MEKRVINRCISLEPEIWNRLSQSCTFNSQTAGNFRNKRKSGGAAKIPQKIFADSGKHWVSKYKSESNYKEKFGASFFVLPG